MLSFVLFLRHGSRPVLFSALLWAIVENCAAAPPERSYSGTPIDVLTYHYDNARTGNNKHEADLTVASVASGKFGRLHTLKVDGDVLAQPLLVSGFRLANGTRHDLLVVATESNAVYAFDATSYRELWHANLGHPQNLADLDCSRVDRFSGVSATPVIARHGPGLATLYVVASTETGNGVFHTVVHALDLANGRDLQPPARIEAETRLADGRLVQFTSRKQYVRAGLAWHDGGLYLGVTARCEFDAKDKVVGWVMRYDETLKQTAAFSTIAKGAGLELASVWAGGFAPAIDEDGSLIAATGNGNFKRGGQDWGESVLRLDASLSTVQDWFTPEAYRKLNDKDLDLGSGGVLLLPTLAGQAAPPLAVAMGKAHVLYLLDRTRLGHERADDSGALQATALKGEGIWGGPCWWLGPKGGRVYYQARDDVMRAYAVDVGATPSLKEAAHGSEQASISLPIVSSHGSDAATGVVWTIDRHRLLAYDAETLGKPIFEGGLPPWDGGTAFLTPLQANGRVYVGSSGTVAVFGLTE